MKPEALKELQEAVSILNYTKDDLTHAGEDIENAVKHLRAALFMETPAPSLKMNLYDIADDDNGTRPIMGCVNHKDGYKVASDSCVLVAIKSDYPEEMEGQSIDKKGEVSDYKYPQWWKLFNSQQRQAEGYQIDFGKLTDWRREFAAEKKLKGKWGAIRAYVKVGDAFFGFEKFVKMAKFMKAVCCNTLHVEAYNRAASCFAEDGSKGLIMPCVCTSVGYHDSYLSELFNEHSDKVIFFESA